MKKKIQSRFFAVVTCQCCFKVVDVGLVDLFVFFFPTLDENCEVQVDLIVKACL